MPPQKKHSVADINEIEGKKIEKKKKKNYGNEDSIWIGLISFHVLNVQLWVNNIRLPNATFFLFVHQRGKKIYRKITHERHPKEKDSTRKVECVKNTKYIHNWIVGNKKTNENFIQTSAEVHPTFEWIE